MKKTVIGIGGFIGSGKTVASQYLEKRGTYLIDSDSVVEELYKPWNDGYRKIMNYFGESYFKKNGELDKKKLAKFVFGDENKLKILNKLVHPMVTNEIQKLINAVEKHTIIVEAVYFEQDQLGRIVDKIIWIDCDEKILLKRGADRKDMTHTMMKKVLDMQKKLNIKPENVDFLVMNNGSIKDLENSIKKVWDLIS